jgi:hypothetical protein
MLLLTCARVFVMAKKYDIPELMRLTNSKLDVVLSNDWNSSSISELLVKLVSVVMGN